VYIFRATREGNFLRDLLQDFHGVLGYDQMLWIAG
jgi:hypothetical protein